MRISSSITSGAVPFSISHLTLVHPFDDPDVIAGQGTIGMEIVRQTGGELDAIFVPVGGGGGLNAAKAAEVSVA